ncbi:MAG: hypothetical protein AAF467_10380 [Actinomycetota bacterium]
MVVGTALFVSAESTRQFRAAEANRVHEVASGSLTSSLGKSGNLSNFSLFLSGPISEQAMRDAKRIGTRHGGILVFHDLNQKTVPEPTSYISRLPLLDSGHITKLVWEESGQARMALYSHERDHWAILPLQPTTISISQEMRGLHRSLSPTEHATDYEWLCEILRREIAQVRPMQDLAKRGEVRVTRAAEIRRTQLDLTISSNEVMAVDKTQPAVWTSELLDLLAANKVVVDKATPRGEVRRIFVLDEIFRGGSQALDDNRHAETETELATLLSLHRLLGISFGLVEDHTDLPEGLQSDVAIYRNSILFVHDRNDRDRGTFYAERSQNGRVARAIDGFEGLWLNQQPSMEAAGARWLEDWTARYKDQALASEWDAFRKNVAALHEDVERRAATILSSEFSEPYSLPSDVRRSPASERRSDVSASSGRTTLQR